ncbi:hypothetical protein Lupro_02885 [Lutibacter profundi]|uniref:Uncharacterized protein n=1 Tax=Lutibacter profundi TaxID=1622118 RepID=A0A0X8G560_9FLAO|nr:hypothetical protein [Lutibacter profundi]AMC10262.1 hypothetical protein Lupro_02885 [Lutibacter profundi]
MDELIKQALNEYFSDYKKYHLIILISFVIIIALIQIIQSVWVSNKIERFKTDLKKSEIKFSRYNELQINSLREIYHKLVAFQLANNLIFKSKPKSVGHSKYKNRINEWIKSYIECANEFAREKILLTDELKSLFTRTLKDFEEVKDILMTEKENLDYWEMVNAGNWNAMYDFEDNELDTISSQIEKLKDKSSIKNSEKHIRELRNKIEIEFTRMAD